MLATSLLFHIPRRPRLRLPGPFGLQALGVLAAVPDEVDLGQGEDPVKFGQYPIALSPALGAGAVTHETSSRR